MYTSSLCKIQNNLSSIHIPGGPTNEDEKNEAQDSDAQLLMEDVMEKEILSSNDSLVQNPIQPVQQRYLGDIGKSVFKLIGYAVIYIKGQ